MRSEDRIRATTQFEGLDMGTGTSQAVVEDGRVEFEVPTSRLIWPDETTLRPVDGLETFEGRTMLQFDHPDRVDPDWESAALVSGDISRSGETLEIDNPDVLPCQTARLLDYIVVPEEGETCASVGDTPIGIKRVLPPESDELVIAFEPNASKLSRCMIGYPDLGAGPAAIVGFMYHFSTLEKSVRMSSVELECRVNGHETRSFSDAEVGGWISGSRGFGIGSIFHIHVQFDLKGREVHIWLRNPHAPEDMPG